MIDLHSHILWGMDDGSKSSDMSLAMVRQAARSGVTHIIATPHVNRRGHVPAWPDIVGRTQELKEMAAAEQLAIEIHSGAEVELNYDTLQFIREDSRDYCLAGSRYILVELTDQSRPDQVEKLLYELMLRGFIPVMAHPERYERLMKQPERILDWMQQGLLCQCNAGSFAGDFGNQAKANATALLQHGMVTFLGTDAHNLDHRNTDIFQYQDAIDSLDSKDKDTWTQCEINEAKLLEDKVFYPDLPEHWQPKRTGLLGRLFGHK